MRAFEIELTVTCRMTLEIKAENELAAKLKATAQIRDGEYTLEDYIRDIELDDIEELKD